MADDDNDVEVRLEDQQRINTFGRLNGRMHELEDDEEALFRARVARAMRRMS